MILSLVWVYFRYIFIYFHTRINESSLFEFEQNFPSIKRYLSFVNRSTKTCVYFHPSFSHIINHRIFVDRFCSCITFPKKKTLLISFLVLTISIDVDRTSLTGASIPQSGVAWSWRNFARAHTPRKKEKKRIWQKGMGGGKRERGRRYRYRFSGKPASRASTNLISMRRIWPSVSVLLCLRIICREIRAR